jgi:hypothetical protein
LKKVLSIGDQATGVSVLVSLYDKMKNRPYEVDLPAMWKELGVEREGDTVRFIDSAPLAAIRRTITYGELQVSSKSTAAFDSTIAFAGQSATSPRSPADSIPRDKLSDIYAGRRTLRQ